jgi:UDP-N-acetylmuramyl pentapeptide phosphotransferase/UDP-N-acetylglucosamine-1-phosphate transferase
MSGFTIVVAAFAIALVAMSLAFMGGAVVVALPVAVLAIGIAAFVDFNRRRKQAASIHDHREQARTDKVEFTERDRQTLVSD